MVHQCSRFADPRFERYMIHHPNRLTLRLANRQKLIFSSICGARPHWVKPFLSHPPSIVGVQGHMLPAHWPDWHERQTVFWGENEEFQHMHTWHMNKVWSLPAFFAEVLVRRKAILADSPFHYGFPSVQKGADKALLALKTWLQYKSYKETHKASTLSLL